MDFYEELEQAKQSDILKIGHYLEECAQKDITIKANLEKDNKSLKSCMEYIMRKAKQLSTGNSIFLNDNVVFGWALHYYDEDIIEETSLQPVMHPTTNTQVIKPLKKEKEQLSLFSDEEFL